MSTSATERFVVCLPTYNERENLERMIESIAVARERGCAAFGCCHLICTGVKYNSTQQANKNMF